MCLHAVAKSDVLSKIFTPCKVHSAVVSSVGLRLADPSPLLGNAHLSGATRRIVASKCIDLDVHSILYCIPILYCV